MLKLAIYICVSFFVQYISLKGKIFISGSPVEEVEETKFLGIIIDRQLSWASHIRYMKNKVAKGLGIILKCRKIFKTETLISLYNSIVYPYFNYCVLIWGSAYPIHLQSVMILQKKLVRIISGVKPRTHTIPLFENMKILTVKEIFYYAVAMFMYKYANQRLPNIFDDTFSHVSDIHSHHTRNVQSLNIPFCKTNRSQHTIRYFGPKIWNIIVKKIDVNCAIGTFKCRLRSLLLSQHCTIFKNCE